MEQQAKLQDGKPLTTQGFATYRINTHFLCGHQNVFIDGHICPGDMLYCQRCCDYQEVVKVDQSILRYVG